MALALVLATGLVAGAPDARAADASGATLARDITVKITLLANETTMIIYDEAAQEYRDRARAGVEALAPLVAALAAEQRRQDAARAAMLVDQWRLTEGALLGSKDIGDGMIKAGYDPRMHSEFETGKQKLLAEIDRLYRLLDPSSPVETRANLLVAQVVANYIQGAGTPFGSYTESYNAENVDLNGQVAKADAALAELARKYKDNREKTAKLQRLNAKWQFIRTTIRKASSQSTPFIVYKHGGDIVRELAGF